MNHLGTKVIETERLYLRPFTVADAGAMYRNWASHPEVTKYLVWPTYDSVDTSRQVLEAWVREYESPSRYEWALVLKETGEPIGSLGAFNVQEDLQKAEVGYCMGKPWWRKGLMKEALGAVLTFLFEEVGLNRVEARHDVNNPHSGGVMKSCGMRYEGTLRQAGVNNQGICDVSIYGILACDRKRKGKG